MYTLLSGLWHHLSRRDEYYVLLVGLDEAGKTVRMFRVGRERRDLGARQRTFVAHLQTLLERLKALANPRYNPLPREKITSTVGMNGAGLRESGDGACVNQRARALSHRRAVGRADVGRARLVFWDLGGQLELQQLWEKVECACVLCIDALC
jgi:ADP-ribosylation factor related protein 1